MFASILDRFGIDFGAVLASQMEPREGGRAVQIGPGAVQEALGSSWFGSFFVLRFGFAFLSLLGASWGRLGALLGTF